MNPLRKSKRKRKGPRERVAAAYRRVNSKPRSKIVRVVTPFGRVRVTGEQARKLRAQMKEIKRKKKRLAKIQAEGPAEDEKT